MADLWPLVPLPEIGETLAWLTDIARSDNSEMRHSLSEGRQYLAYRFQRSGDFQKAEALFRSNPLGEWLVPVWHEASKVGAVQPSDTTLSANMDASYGSQALIFGGKDTWQVVDVQSVGAELTLTSAVGASYDNPTVAPLRTCIMPAGAGVARQTRRHGAIEIEFLAADVYAPSGATYPVHSGLSYLGCAGAVLRPLSGKVNQPHYTIDNGFGPVNLAPMRSLVDGRYAVSLVFGQRPELMAFRRFLGDVRGRDGAFWVPAWLGRLTLRSGLSSGATSAQIVPVYDDLTVYAGKTALIGDEFRTISSAVVSGSDHQINFAALTASATSARLLQRVRMDTDRIEFKHRRGLASAVSFSVIEVPA